MSYRILLGRNHGHERVPDRDLDGFETDSGSARHRQKIVDDSSIIDDIATTGQCMGLEVDTDNIEELLEDHGIELSTEELEHHQSDHEKNWLMKLKKTKRIKKMSQCSN